MKEHNEETKTLEVLNAVNPELCEKTINRLSEVKDESKLRIAFVGQHNAGKSTVVSALTGNREIRISSNVETDSTSEYEWGDVLLYDTPGLYAGVKEEHDNYALEAIKSSDVIIFCITSSLFDDLMIHDFVNLAYKQTFRNKIILLVNKMGQEDGDFEILTQNYTKTLSKTIAEEGGTLDDFPIAFVDAKDYREGIDSDDPELIDFSHFETFIELLNKQIERKGLSAKIETRCTILLDAIGEAVASTGTEVDKNMMTILNRLTRLVRKYKNEMKNALQREEDKLRNSIMDIGDTLVSKIGVEEITEAMNNEVNYRIEETAQQSIESIEKRLTEVNDELNTEISEILSSKIGEYVFSEINVQDIRVMSKTAIDYSVFVEKYSQVENMARQATGKLQSYVLKNVGTTGKLIDYSGTTVHSLVLNIGHFFGHSFKPWEAVKIAKNVGTVAKFAGPVMDAVGVLITMGEKIVEERQIKKIEEAKTKSYNSFSNIASDLIAEIDKQYELLEAEAFTAKTSEIETIRNDIIEEAQSNSKHIAVLKEENATLHELLEVIAAAV